MATLLSDTFSDAGTSSSIGVKKGDAITYTVDLSNDFDGVLYLRFTKDNQEYSLTEISADATAVQIEVADDGLYDFKCEYGAGLGSLTGTAAYTLASIEKILHEVKDFNGVTIFKVTEAGVEVAGTSALTGAVTIVGDTSVTGDLANSGVTTGVGAKNGATVTVAETGNSVIHKTVLTLASTPVTVVSVTTGNGVGGYKIYDFPAGYIRVLGCTADLSLAIAAGKQADFTDGTPEGDIGIGSVAPANADSFGTDATDDDYGTGAAFTMTDYAATADISPEAAGNFDGTSTAKDVYVNVLVDAADIDDDATTEVEVSGTVTLTWINLGDY